MKQKRGRKKKKSGRGRKEGTGVLSGIKPWSEEWSDIRGRIIHGSAEWRIVRLRQLLLAQKKEQATAHRNMLLAEQKACRDEKLRSKYNEALRQSNDLLAALERGDEKVWKLTDNFFSARAADIQAKAASAPKVTVQDLDRLWNKLRAKRKGKPPARDEWLAARDELYKAKTGKPYEPKPPDEIAWLWRELAGQFQRAVLNGDGDWFTRQAKAIRWNDKRTKSQKERARFNAKVLDLFEHAVWWTHAKQRDDRESLTLTPAGKFTDSMASDIYNALEKHELPNGHLIVAGCRFENKERVMEAIHELAKQLQFALRKQH